MQRNTERGSDVCRGKRVGEHHGPRHVSRFAIAAACSQAAESPGDVPQGDAGREDIAGGPERHPMTGDVPEGDADCEEQPAVKHASQPREIQQVARVLELIEVDDEQEQLGADKRGNDDVDPEVQHPVRVQSPFLCPPHRQAEAEQVGGGQQDAIGIDGERSEFKQLWIHVFVPDQAARGSSARRRS